MMWKIEGNAGREEHGMGQDGTGEDQMELEGITWDRMGWGGDGVKRMGYRWVKTGGVRGNRG